MSFIEGLTKLLDDTSVSDVHLQQDTAVWCRRHGDMVAEPDLRPDSKDLKEVLKHRYVDDAVLSVQTKGGQDDYAFTLGQHRIRAHVWIARAVLNMSMRKLSGAIPSLEELGLPEATMDLANADSGLTLVVGATGSGKSTTLASMVNAINKDRKGHIVTLEDPIEYIHRDGLCRVRQREIGESGDCQTFAAGVIAAMREDPDVILVGEIKDAETVRAAFMAAQTGHLVLGTLHTNSATETIERLLAFFADSDRELAKSVLSSVLRGVVAQRLIKTLDGGRVLAAELMKVTQQIRANIRRGEIVSIEQAMETGQADGQITLNRSLETLVTTNRIARETALFAANKRELLEKRLG